jgi:hypothetical protein
MILEICDEKYERQFLTFMCPIFPKNGILIPFASEFLSFLKISITKISSILFLFYDLLQY